ncbi:hypothetical protein [Microbulbifer sp. THAF38]|uniref:hypothetical protein n=1 Tax=Microbulbifer sp. THAF38 TaxID=2587856 RepID=UPI00126841DB|nr:hypothetical protein [Microbulbifer sp. THAF38]QFT56476.1 hypothetical protein FIU95_18165 [Microbulbifer sp. THAF38]
MAIQKKEFFYHSKDHGDEWWCYLARDTEKPCELFVIVERFYADYRASGEIHREQIPLAKYLSSEQRGKSNLIKLIGGLIGE